jgi:acyl-CoA thioester hydrolase
MTSAERPGLSGEIRGGRHVLPVRVYYEDTDFSGVVYHASYLRFMERGRTDYLRLLGIDHRAMFEKSETPGFAFVVTTMTIDFLKAAYMDDILEIVTQPDEVGGARATLLQQVMRDGETLIEARVHFAIVARGRPQRMPKPLREAMQAHLAERAKAAR